MDWLSAILWHLTMLTIINEVYSIRVNPFSGLPEAPYDPVADYSIGQGSYIPNLPMASIFPLMNDDSVNTMVGIPSLKSQLNPFINPLLSHVPQASVARPSSNRNKPKNNRNSNQKNLNRNPQQRGRGVTLDVRGGGYKVDQLQNAKPYKAPIAESSVRNTQRYNGGGSSGKTEGNGPPRSRKQNQRPRGPNMKNPHYNMKFESSLPSIPPNVEFVSPENVLPFHPRIYKQFLQQNKQFGALLQNMNKQNAFKSSSQNGGNFDTSFQKNAYNQAKQVGSKVTRNRGNSLNSPIAQSSQLSNFPQNFQMPGSSDFTSQFGFPQQQNSGKSPSSPLDNDFFNQDPNFFASLSQTPEGQAYIGQLYQQYQMKNQNKPRPNSPRGPFVNKPPQQNQNPSFPNSGLPSFQSGMKLPHETGIPSPYNANFYSSIHGPLDGSHNQASNAESEYQKLMMNFQQQMQQFSPGKQFSLPNSPASLPTYREPGHLSTPSPVYPSNQQPYENSQIKNNPYNDYPYTQGTSYQDSQSQVSVGAHQSYGKNTNTPYDVTNYPSTYQASQKHVKSQASNIQTADQAGYTLPPYSPVDPLASLENGNPGVQDYYTYQHTSHHKSPVYSNDQSSPSYTGSSALHEISPYPEKNTDDAFSISLHNNDPVKSQSINVETGYMTPEQLLGPKSSGLQSEVKFHFPSDRETIFQASTSSSSESLESDASSAALSEQNEGGDRAALHLPEEVSIYVARQTDNPFLYEFTESYEPFSYELEDKPKAENPSSEQSDSKDVSALESESDEKLHESIQEFQKLLTKAPKSSYMVEPTESTPSTKGLKTTTTRAPVHKKAYDSDEMKNHKNTHSYMFQYAPAEKSSAKSSPTWQAWKPNASKYHLPLPDAKPQVTTTTTTPSPTTLSTAATPTPTTAESSAAAGPHPTQMSFYHEPETPICARYNNLTYCLQDPEYPKDQIKEAIEKNRHPLDHFLVDISASSNVVDDNVDKVFENSVPLQSTSVSYSFEGKAIAPAPGEVVNSTGCTSNVYYAKPLRAINTAGLWKIIVNVEFEETGANYTQTVRIEECSHTSGYVATCGTETISACLQQYKLYRLLAWESHRGFYIDAFLLPISCFCGSQQSR